MGGAKRGGLVTLQVDAPQDRGSAARIAAALAREFGVNEGRIKRAFGDGQSFTLLLSGDDALRAERVLKREGLSPVLLCSRRDRALWPWLVGCVVLAALASAMLYWQWRSSDVWPWQVMPAEASRIEPTLPIPTPEVGVEVAALPSLFHAARLGDLDMLREAMGLGEDLNVRDVYGQTPLMYAVDHAQLAVVTVLLAAGADPNAASEAGWTPLMYAAREGRTVAITQALLNAGADPARRNAAGESALDIARAEANAEVAATLQAAVPTALVPQVRIAVAQPRPIATPRRPPPNPALLGLESVQDPMRALLLRCLEDWERCGTD
jgi:hypothetical protein